MSHTALEDNLLYTSALAIDDPLVRKSPAAKFTATHQIERTIDHLAQGARQEFSKIVRAGAAQQQYAHHLSLLSLPNRKARKRHRALHREKSPSLLNSWQGQIIEMREKTFLARLFDPMRANVLELAEFDYDEPSRDDQDLVKIGAVFYWYIYRAHGLGGEGATSILWFRRRGKMTPAVFDAEKKNFDDAWDAFGWGPAVSAAAAN